MPATAIMGRKAELWVVSGAGTAMTKDACELVSTKRYHATNPAHRYLSPSTAILVYDNNVLVTSGYHIEGGCHIVFDATPTTPVTVTGAWLTPVEIVLVQGWELQFQQEMYKITSLGDTAHKYMGSGLMSWSGSFNRFREDNAWAAIAMTNTTQLIGRFFEDQPAGRCWTGWISPNAWTGTQPLELATESFTFDGVGKPVYTTDET